MQCSNSKTNVRLLAAVIMAAFVICFSAGVALGASRENDKVHSRADKALREGDYASAEKLYRDLLAKDPHDKEARLGLSFTLLKKRQPLANTSFITSRS